MSLKRSGTKFLFCLIVATASCLPLSAPNANTSAYERQINEVDERIKVSRDTIRSKESEQASLQRLLNNYNSQIEAVRKQRSTLKGKIGNLQITKDQGTAKSDSLRQGVLSRNQTLSAHLSAMYRTGRNPQLRTILSIDDPSASSRMLRYYQKVAQHRVKEMQVAQESLGKAINAVTLTAEQQSQLQLERDALQAREQELSKLSKKRSTLLSKIGTTLSSEQSRLSELQSDKIKLQALVDDLRQQEKVAEARSKDGSLPWPLVGNISAQFGDLKAQGNAKWAGIMIDALKGLPVVAVHEGEVVYAEWLRGFGLLIILDHGNDMMSLYGNNDELMYNVGETVLPGDTIATVGDSSSLNQSGLYFELRKDGNPIDPMGLLSTNVVAAKR